MSASDARILSWAPPRFDFFCLSDSIDGRARGSGYQNAGRMFTR